MNFIVEKPSATQITITVHAPYPELEALFSKAAAAISAETEIEGFRKGHAPAEVVRQKVGAFKILEQAARRYISEKFPAILQQVEQQEFKAKSLELVGDPAVTISKLAPGEAVEYQIVLALLPPIRLPDYKAIAKRMLATKKVPEVSQAEVESSLEWLRESRAELMTVARPAQTGDRVEIDFQATHGGVKLEAGQSQNHPFILGQGHFLPGFENQLLGMEAGETKTFTLAAPLDYPDQRLAGKALEFTTTMKLVQERRVPAWDDALARSLGGNFTSTAEVAESVQAGLETKKEQRERERIRMAMIEAMADACPADIPALLIERELEKMIAELEQSTNRMGLSFENYLAHIKRTETTLKEEWRANGERRVKVALILRQVARQEGIQPSQEEIQAAAENTTARLGISEENMKTIDREAFLDYNRGIARNEKVFQFLEGLRE